VRKLLGVALLVLAVAAIVTVARDPLYWKRYMLAALYAPTNLPDSFYEPGEVLEGVDGPEPPRVDPAYEHLSPESLEAAADHAGKTGTQALIVGRNGHIVFERYWDGGRFDTEADAGAFNAALAALAVGIAMDDRKIGLADEPAANYLQEFRADDRRHITLAHLLSQSSGLAAAGPGAGPWSGASHERFSGDILSECFARKTVAAPGKKWLQQACDVQLLARVVERATGEQYARYLSDRLWKPIGAADARLARDHASGVARADCCIRARRGDWMRIAEVLANDGKFQGEQIVTPGWITNMLAPSGANAGFGYGVWRGAPFVAEAAQASEPYAAPDTHLLKAAGKTRLWFVPSMRLTILRIGANDEADRDWDDSSIPNLIIRGAADFEPRSSQADPKDLSRLVPKH